jgi:RNA-directed DNA polymerase
LGFSFWTAPGRIIRRHVSGQALRVFRDRVRELTRRSGGRSLRELIAEL